MQIKVTEIYYWLFSWIIQYSICNSQWILSFVLILEKKWVHILKVCMKLQQGLVSNHYFLLPNCEVRSHHNTTCNSDNFEICWTLKSDIWPKSVVSHILGFVCIRIYICCIGLGLLTSMIVPRNLWGIGSRTPQGYWSSQIIKSTGGVDALLENAPGRKCLSEASPCLKRSPSVKAQH